MEVYAGLNLYSTDSEATGMAAVGEERVLHRKKGAVGVPFRWYGIAVKRPVPGS